MNRQRLFILTALMMAASLGACATAYHKRGAFDEFGYTDKKIGDDQFSVTANGDHRTPQVRVAAIALLRAARLTQEQGRTHFVIVKQGAQDLDVVETIVVPLPLGGVPIPVGESATTEPVAYVIIRLVPRDAPPPADAINAADVIAQYGKEF